MFLKKPFPPFLLQFFSNVFLAVAWSQTAQFMTLHIKIDYNLTGKIGF